MESRHWTGSDERDSLVPDYDSEVCLCCGARDEEPCEPDCICTYCVGKRAREAAMRALDIVPEDAA